MNNSNENKKVLLLKYGEVVMKGLNRGYFESLIVKRAKEMLKKAEGNFSLEYAQSTLYVSGDEDADIDEAFSILKKLFGIATICVGYQCEKNMNSIKECVKQNAKKLVGNAKTFKCESKRSDKSFPLKSPQISSEIGGVILEAMHSLRVDVKNPDITLFVEVREKFAYVHNGGEKGLGGMPSGSAGKGLLLLSGGIDSPVAGYMMSKRGISVDCVYFESPPYTSDNAKQKVVDLASKLAEYNGKLFLNCISVTEIQEELMNKCDNKLFTVLLRRFMMRLALKNALRIGAQLLITGESIGQVASQTVPAMAVTDAIATIPVIRPLAGLDKEEIVQISRAIETFDISILPYDDCCTVFTPKHPNTRPTLEGVIAEENKLDVDGLVERAFSTRYVVEIK